MTVISQFLIKTDIIVQNSVCFSAAVGEEETSFPGLSGVSFTNNQETLKF